MTIPADLVDTSPLHDRTHLRICQVRATESTAASGLDAIGGPLTRAFHFGRLNDFIDSAADLAPRIAATSHRDALDLTGSRQPEPRPCRWQRLRVDIAGGGLVDIRLISTPFVSLPDAIALIEDLFHEQLEGEPSGWDAAQISDPGPATDNTDPFHQVVMWPDGLDEPDWEIMQRLIYRADLDAKPDYSSIGRPDELNRRPGQGAAVGSFGSVLWGQQDYVESGVILSAALTVSATASLQATRAKAHNALRQLHSLARGDEELYTTLKQRRLLRADLVETQETISLLEAELTFGAEASATIVPLLPSLRIEAYHQSLHEAADISRQALLVDRMLGRLRASSEAELSALQNVEASLSQLRIRRWSIAAQTLAAVTIPLSLLLSYFGMSTNDIERDSSLFDVGRYWPIYAAMAALVAACVLLIVILRRRDMRRIPRSSRASRYYQGP